MPKIKPRGRRALRLFLREHDLSFSAFARKVKVTKQCIHLIATGKRKPSRDLEKRIDHATAGTVALGTW